MEGGECSSDGSATGSCTPFNGDLLDYDNVISDDCSGSSASDFIFEFYNSGPDTLTVTASTCNANTDFDTTLAVYDT